MIGPKLNVIKNNNFLSLKLFLILNFETSMKSIVKKGMCIAICLVKNIKGWLIWLEKPALSKPVLLSAYVIVEKLFSTNQIKWGNKISKKGINKNKKL